MVKLLKTGLIALMGILVTSFTTNQITEKFSEKRHISHLENPNFVDLESYKVATQGTLFSGGLSSCSVVCFYDKENRIGALAHYPLGWINENWREILGARKILEELVISGAEKSKVQGYSILSSGTDYILKNLEKNNVKNKIIQEHRGLKNVELDIDRGEVKISDYGSVKKYEL